MLFGKLLKRIFRKFILKKKIKKNPKTIKQN